MNHKETKLQSQFLYFILILFGLCLAFFFTFRFSGQWIESDTAIMHRLITEIQSKNTITPEEATYPHGFLFQAFSVLLSDLSGFDVSFLQSRIYPFISVILLMFCAWWFYSQASENVGVTSMAVLLLCFQAEVLFVVLRGSHEKLDWPLMMVSLGLLYNSLRKNGLELILHILLFYLVAFAQISINVYFATTFLTAIFLSLVIGLVIFSFQSRTKKIITENPVRLLYITLLVGVLVYIFIFYLYLPALGNLRTTETIYQQLQNLMVNPESASTPYAYITFGWINKPTYFGVSIFTWLLIVGSMIIWFWRGWRLFRGQDRLTLKRSLDWLLYAGFALQVGASIIIDYSGALSENFQLRVFPGYTMMAVLLLSSGLVTIFSLLELKPIPRMAISIVLLISLSWLSIAGLLKASNEPLLSNQWMIYTQGEIRTVDWGVTHLENSEIWTGIDSRIRDAYVVNYEIINGNKFRSFRNFQNIKYAIYSKRDVLRAERTGFPLPPVFGWLQVYDNGEAQFLKKPPVTPFQR